MNNRFDFLGVHISIINPSAAVDAISKYDFRSPSYVSFPDASVIKEAHGNPLLTNILNSSFLTMPDGKPSQVVARLKGHKSVSTVSGFHLCKALLQKNTLTHYFYGGDEATLGKLKNNLEREFPNAKILGYKSPPFVAADQIATSPQLKQDISEINALQPDIVWIGISSPKQDYLIHHYHQHFTKSLMMGVGGVFLYLADESLKSPEWVKKMGLRWAYRLSKEPARLWPKYYATFRFLLGNLGFFMKLAIRRK
ncbi:WecB/TagA/CpsF family glycosyltransferase [Paraflavitalea pollutisoli]|uniref:WecB/TagA/CpsF family glycosyltransferase n=1 Tax=Paraflavitalea pollutisoli TaxID=3034143 RepID=UPI0023EE01FB|nr:WecB/TagA/CpsF family glycosyltransferase [Paraflavitalea sp. H1-2-19X]